MSACVFVCVNYLEIVTSKNAALSMVKDGDILSTFAKKIKFFDFRKNYFWGSKFPFMQ